MKLNEANWERITRVVVGLALVAVGGAAVGGAVGVIAITVGLILTVTGSVGWCPIHAALKTGTRRETVV